MARGRASCVRCPATHRASRVSVAREGHSAVLRPRGGADELDAAGMRLRVQISDKGDEFGDKIGLRLDEYEQRSLFGCGQRRTGRTQLIPHPLGGGAVVRPDIQENGAPFIRSCELKEAREGAVPRVQGVAVGSWHSPTELCDACWFTEKKKTVLNTTTRKKCSRGGRRTICAAVCVEEASPVKRRLPTIHRHKSCDPSRWRHGGSGRRAEPSSRIRRR